MVAERDVRERLLGALRADLVGPFDPETAEAEVLPLAPSRWYLTGFLVPEGKRTVDDPTEEDDAGAGSAEARDDAELEEHVQKQPKFFPASMGLSVLLPSGSDDSIAVRLTWAEYVRDEVDPDPAIDGERTRKVKVWRRVPHGPQEVVLALDEKSVADGQQVPNTSHIWVGGKMGHAEGRGLDAGTRALSVFVVNQRTVPDDNPDEQTLFQVELELEFLPGFQPRPNLTGLEDPNAQDRDHPLDDRIADLQYRSHFEYAVGHGVSWIIPEGGKSDDGTVTRVRTTWIPRSEVPPVQTAKQDGVTVAMKELARLEAGEVRSKLGALVEEYGRWIAKQRAADVGDPARADVRDPLMDRAEEARQRIAAGIDLLAQDDDVRLAFAKTNEALATTRERGGDPAPQWRLFQLAFVLMNLPCIADPKDDHRDDVELIFFPTGGGKTEAYLGVIAVTLLLRRLRGHQRDDQGLGVAVILRYTLRLLTLDQLKRASALICALERIRLGEPRLGQTRFSIGLWVGKSATANTLSEVARKVRDYKAQRGSNPFPLTHCPWCGHEIDRDSLTLWPKPTKAEEVRVACMRPDCDFNGYNTRGDGLPVLFVDEQIYNELPCFVVATVDKFAMLPWRGETGKLFGRVDAVDGRRFYGPAERTPKRGVTVLEQGLPPPELIVQDELHLISGPLGTMVGLYETAVEVLCTGNEGQSWPKPKILASTATVRRAHQQCQALFGRKDMNLFPPPGIDAFETFFAHVDRKSPGRLYVGVAAPGRSMKQILLRTYVTLLGAGLAAYDKDSPATQRGNAYTTVAGYFNSLRELGGMRRLAEDDVRSRCLNAEHRRPRNSSGPHPWVVSREIREPVELTSRESTDKISAAKSRLDQPLQTKHHVDVLLASNMISVGVDIDRLGLMVVAGQPKTTSEYIQATSRVGRKREWPGLVVTCFNLHKPRDRSHYERFPTYHESFYRFVEAPSLTPFSPRALERGLAALLVTMVRLGNRTMTAPKGVMNIAALRAFANEVGERIAERAAMQPGVLDSAAHAERVRDRVGNLLDHWTRVVSTPGAQRIYSRFDRPRQEGRALLRTAMDDLADDVEDAEEPFILPTSMRDVEGAVHLWVERYALGGKTR